LLRLAVGVVVVAVLAAAPKAVPEFDGSARDADRTIAAAASLRRAATGLPPSASPAFTVGQPRLLERADTTGRYAPVVSAVRAVESPRPDADPVVSLRPKTEEGTNNVVFVLGETRQKGRSWVHVRLPVLPNGRTGWVPRTALGGYRFVRTRLVVDRARLRATLFESGRPVFSAPVGVGTAAAPTPAGEFYVRLKLAGFDDPFYGPVAFGTSARSAVLTDWPGGGYIGIHGTNAPELLPGRVSHGCVRMRNEDIVELGRLMPVGTPLTIL
jgi:lipoprotein-anchoring transpeptidase ErfK/SrfK